MDFFYVIYFALAIIILVGVFNLPSLEGRCRFIKSALIGLALLLIATSFFALVNKSNNETEEAMLASKRELAGVVQEEFLNLSLKMMGTKHMAAEYCKDGSANINKVMGLANEFIADAYFIQGPLVSAEQVYPAPIVNSMNNFLHELGAEEPSFPEFCSQAKIDRAALLIQLKRLNSEMSSFVNTALRGKHDPRKVKSGNRNK